MPSSFSFVPPPEAPVFYPSPEEFEDPLAYLMKIRPICVKTGICKIVPPKCWNPPFAVNMKEFSFTPRIQRLYELEAHSRIKLNFISRLYKFVQLQGGDKIRVPSISGRYLDLYNLHKHVTEAGGYRQVCDCQSWSGIAEKLGYQNRHAHTIKTNYEKLLLPFDQAVSYPSHPTKAIHKPRLCSYKRCKKPTEEDRIDYSASNELRNLQFFGAGRKAVVPKDGRPSNFKPELNIDEYNCRVCGYGDDETNLLVCDTDSCQACYHLYCLDPPLRSIPKCQWKCPECIRAICCNPTEVYGFPQSSKTYSLQEFGVMADQFKSTYFKRPCTDVPCGEVEREFWRILQEYNDDVVVEYGADIHSSSQGSGFPTKSMLKNLVGTASQLAEAKKYADSPWNLNILPLLDRSVLRFIKGNIDGMKIPWCYVGMVFSSFCWHIEDHWSYSINFNHWGEPKTWYGVSRLHADDFERAIKKHASELFDQAPDLLHHITTNVNPNILQAEGVPIYRTDQHCGEFVVTFPRAYHAGFNQGFNFAEAVNICLPDWLPIGRACIEHYAEIKRHCVFSNDELLCTLAEVAVGNVLPEEILTITNPVNNCISGSECSDNLESDVREKLPPGCSTSGLDIGAVAIVHQEFACVLKEERKLREIATQSGITNSRKVRFDEMPDDARVCDFCLTTLFLSGVSCSCIYESNTDIEGPKNQFNHSLDHRSTTARKYKVFSDSSSTMDESNEEGKRSPSHMVCLKHVSKLCSKCPRSVFVLNYHYSIEELCSLEQSLGNRLSHFYSWKNQLSFLIKPSDPNTSCSQFIKQEANNSSSFSDSNNPTSATITLVELEMRLAEGKTAGYHTDDIYNDAKAILDRGKHLQQICARLKPSIIGTGNIDKFKNPLTSISSTVDPVKFQTRRPATFTVATSSTSGCATPPKIIKLPSNNGYVVLNHELDVNNPREYDLLRLMESCEQQHPLNLFEDSSVQLIKQLLNQLTTWRQSIRNIINLLCNLVLTNATRSISTSFSMSNNLLDIGIKPDCLPSNFHTLSTDDQALMILDHSLEKLRNEFPLYVYRLSEWNSLNLLRHALRWLCVYSRYDNNKSIYWSLPHLRKYLVLGEEIISQLTAVTSSQKSQKTNHSVSPSTPLSVRNNQVTTLSSLSGINVSNMDTAITQIMRFVLARMHTSLGSLTQSGVQVETLVGILTEILTSSRSHIYEDIKDILCQLKNLGINHLTAVNRQISLTDQLNSALDERYFDSIVDTQSATTSEDITQLKSLFKRRVDNVINSCSPDKHSLEVEPSYLIEAEILCEFASLFSTTSKSDHMLNFVTTQQKIIVMSDTLDRQLSKLNDHVANTKRAISDLYCKVFPHHHLPAHDVQTDSLLEFLLPAFSVRHQKYFALQSFKDACSSGHEHAVSVYKQQTKEHFDYISSTLENMFINGTSCDACSKRFRISKIITDHVNSDHAACDLCSLFPEDPSVYPTLDWLSRFGHHWSISATSSVNNVEVVDLTDENDCGNYGILVLLYCPVSIALRCCLDQIQSYLVHLEQILKSHGNQLDEVISSINQSLIQQLPSCLINFSKQVCHSQAPSLFTNSSDFTHGLCKILCVLLTFNVNLIPCVQFIEQILSSVYCI
ncbi:hypothetical protein MN116_003355 [Schistosoma mekongi]|uniref:[histone H3]-trimethyl-L-lysine(4) demethylase n=1 Tax=Schistosoma mekongi TaxID=38744 RepID=A0AAE1ZI01_SCHME|nr:hypothetical protein MN116_003355 [Schistosoma mekongi]